MNGITKQEGLTFLLGSVSDQGIGSSLIEEMKASFGEWDLQFLSAHRKPEELQCYLKGKIHPFPLVFAGAGLSAHLPGVVASQVDAAVIGLALNQQYGGLDAWCSVWQMPFGVPVLAVYPYGKSWQSFCAFFASLLPQLARPRLHTVAVIDQEELGDPFLQKEKSRVQKIADLFQVQLQWFSSEKAYWQEHAADPCPVIATHRTPEWQAQSVQPLPAVRVPVIGPRAANLAQTVFEWWPLYQQHAPWVGTNQVGNALLSWMQLRGLSSEEKELMKKIRRGEIKW